MESGYDVQIQEMRRLMKSTSDPTRLEEMKLSIDQLLSKQQKHLQNVADGTNEIELDPFQDFTQSPSVTSGNTRPMSSRPMSARRRSVPNLNAVPENNGLQMTIQNPRNTPSAINHSLIMNNVTKLSTSSPNDVNRKKRRGSMNAVSITEDIFSPQLLSGTAEKMAMIGSGPAAVIAKSKIGSERRDRRFSEEMTISPFGSPSAYAPDLHSGRSSRRGSREGASLLSASNLQSLESSLDKYDGYSSSESISSTTSDRTPLARKRRGHKLHKATHILGSLDDVIEETPVFHVEEMPVFNLADDVSIFGNLKELSPALIGKQFCTSGHIDCFGLPLVPNKYTVAAGGGVGVNGGGRKMNAVKRVGEAKMADEDDSDSIGGRGGEGNGVNNSTSNPNNNNKSPRKQVKVQTNFTPWITTGLFPQFYVVDFKRKVDIKKVVLAASGVRKMHLEVFEDSSLTGGRVFYSNTARDDQDRTNDESSLLMSAHSFFLGDNKDVERGELGESGESKSNNEKSSTTSAAKIKIVIESSFTNCHFVVVQALKVLCESSNRLK